MARAVVIGGSIGGLLAARVLSEVYTSVVVLDRDTLPDQPVSRRGVPQGRQLHVLLARGREVLDELFPACPSSSARRSSTCTSRSTGTTTGTACAARPPRWSP